jgi:L,D-peptidoglycan transpeptidase YkuD (ErfK/YbiS/YcfS/YnhG family)
MIKNIILFFSIFLISCTFENKTPENIFFSKKINNTEKIILVLTKNWETKHAEIYFFEKKKNKWLKLEKTISGLIGNNGLGMGLGLHDSIKTFNFKDFPQKKEGDKKSPAGIFSISQIMGYDSVLFCGNKLNYRQITSSLHAVDDVSSTFYNQIVDTLLLDSTYQFYYQSFENLHKMSYYYEWIFRIDHNLKCEKAKGSNIFFHIWDKNGEGSAGCTTVSRQNMRWVLNWINKKTLIIQFPKPIYEKIFKDFNLPECK